MSYTGTIICVLLFLSIPAISQDQTINKERCGDRDGFYIHLTASSLAGEADDDNPNILSIGLSGAYMFENGFSLGAGSGIEELGIPLLPFYGYIRYDPHRSEKSSLYLWARGGYGLSLKNDENYDNWYKEYFRGGPLVNGGFGLQVNPWPGIGINIGLGYRYQKVSTFHKEVMWGNNEEVTRETFTEFNRFELQFGIVFM